MTVKVLAPLVLVLAARQVYMFSMGAPDSACQAITPGHSHQPQTSDSPALLKLSSNYLAPGNKIKLELTTKDNSTFKGFIIQARNLKLKDQQVGSFITSGDAVSYLTCGRGIHNSITHRKAEAKTSIEAEWMAPSDFDGAVIFRYTFLKEYKTFWVGAETEKVRVSRSPAEEEEEKKEEDQVQSDVLELEPSPKSDEAIKVIDKIVEDNSITDQETEKDEDIPQPAQNADIARPSSATEEKLGEEEENTPAVLYISSTTTLRPTTTTTLPPRRVLLTSDSLTNPADPIFEGCNSTKATKACFGYPDGCVEDGRCEMIVTYEPAGDLGYLFHMKGRSSGYVSIALSRDQIMGDDLTTNCVVSSNGAVDINTGYNYGHSGNTIIKRGGNRTHPVDGITERIENSRKDGWISCKWKRSAEMMIESEAWSLGEDRYHLMLARGEAPGGRIKHHTVKTVSGEARGLGEVGSVKSKSKLLIFLHGAFMIGAWICSASLGIILARYYKQTWTEHRCQNLDQWFIWHRNFMMLTWSLTIAGFIMILLELKGLTETLWISPHAFVGFTTVGLCFLQPFLALVRCSPNDSMRPLFNWVHWFIGNSAQILAIVAIFYAVDLPKAELPRPQTDWLLVAFVAFHFLTHLVLSAINCSQDNNKMNYPPRLRHMSRNGHVFPDYEELKGDSNGHGLRIFVLVVYFIINVIVTGALVLLVVLAPTRPMLVDWGVLPE